MFCPKCGTQTESGNYCRSCGANLTRVAKVISNPELNHRSVARRDSGTTVGIFNSAVVTNEARDLDGHNATAVFGGVRVDLSATPLYAGEVRLNLLTVFGGAEVIVPDDVGIRVTGVTIFAGLSVRGQSVGNALFSVNDYTTPNYAKSTRRLHIDATAIFGGVTIKRE